MNGLLKEDFAPPVSLIHLIRKHLDERHIPLQSITMWKDTSASNSQQLGLYLTVFGGEPRRKQEYFDLAQAVCEHAAVYPSVVVKDIRIIPVRLEPVSSN